MIDQINSYDFASLDGTNIHYQVSGMGPDLVMIHGFTFDIRCWDDQFETFVSQNQVLRYDLRGHGRSSPPTIKSYTYHDDLRNLVEILGIGSTCLIGHSLGGSIAINFALKYPEHTSALVLVDPGLGGFDWSGDVLTWMDSTWNAASVSGLEEAREVWLRGTPWKPALEIPEVAARVREMIRDYSGWHWMNDNPHEVPEIPAIQRLGDIQCPTLLIIGGRNPVDYHRLADTLENNVPNIRRVIIPSAGHAPNMEAPEEFNRKVTEFLSEIGHAA